MLESRFSGNDTLCLSGFESWLLMDGRLITRSIKKKMSEDIINYFSYAICVISCGEFYLTSEKKTFDYT